MTSAKFFLVLAASAVACGLQPTAAWATRAIGAVVTGEITAAPTSSQIEIAHHVYHIKANSPAAAAAHSFYYGQVVDAIFDKPGAHAQSEVVAITAHKN